MGVYSALGSGKKRRKPTVIDAQYVPSTGAPSSNTPRINGPMVFTGPETEKIFDKDFLDILVKARRDLLNMPDSYFYITSLADIQGKGLTKETILDQVNKNPGIPEDIKESLRNALKQNAFGFALYIAKNTGVMTRIEGPTQQNPAVCVVFAESMKRYGSIIKASTDMSPAPHDKPAFTEKEYFNYVLAHEFGHCDVFRDPMAMEIISDRFAAEIIEKHKAYFPHMTRAHIQQIRAMDIMAPISDSKYATFFALEKDYPQIQEISPNNPSHPDNVNRIRTIRGSINQRAAESYLADNKISLDDKEVGQMLRDPTHYQTDAYHKEFKQSFDSWHFYLTGQHTKKIDDFKKAIVDFTEGKDISVYLKGPAGEMIKEGIGQARQNAHILEAKRRLSENLPLYARTVARLDKEGAFDADPMMKKMVGYYLDGVKSFVPSALVEPGEAKPAAAPKP